MKPEPSSDQIKMSLRKGPISIARNKWKPKKNWARGYQAEREWPWGKPMEGLGSINY